METTNLSALALVPDGQQWPAIQAFRIDHDREIHKWPPHINIFYPFLPESDFETAASTLSRELAKLGPLRIRFTRFGNFGGTVFLEPDCHDDPGLARLHAACKTAFPEIPEKHSCFQPHLTIGQFRGKGNAEAFIRKQNAISIETEISCVSLLARDSMKTPFRTPFRVLLGNNGRVDRGDASLYTCEAPWRWTMCQCLPACTGTLGGLARTFSGPAVRLVRSLSRQGPARTLEMSDEDLTSRFAESRNGLVNFHTEFRFTEPGVCQAIAGIQEDLRLVDPSIYMDQACAPDNIHFTMHEIQLQHLRDVHRVVEVLEGVAASLLQPATVSTVDLHGVGIFNDRILYAKPAENDAAAYLHEVFDRIQQALVASDLKPRDRGQFTPHATLCKSKRGESFSESVLSALRDEGYDAKRIGSQPLLELHFCVQRNKEELKPPVIWRLRLGRNEEEVRQCVET